VALKKSDLYSSLWKSCDELRGGMDASQYKDYILTLLFVKYVSDKAKADPNSLIDVPAGGSFDDMLAAKGDKEIGDRFNKIIGKLAEANGLRNVIDQADFNDEEKLGKGKEMQDRLAKLVTIFNDLDFRGSRADGDDLLGDAYEYLMRHFATESGKSKGQFYTPAEVSRILAKVVGIGGQTRQDQTVFDPACGSGSLLLKAAAEAPRGMTIYGQEKDNATWALAKMNMILHGNEIAEIEKGDTIANPQFVKGNQLRTFDFVVMNPPFSVKSWSNGLENDYDRFQYGMPPEKNGDYAFLLHALKSLKSTGKAAIILPHGVLFRGNAEATIRKRLLKQGFIKGVIGLPANLFYGTGIPACIVILDKENAVGRTGVFMIEASKGFTKDGNKNRLRSRDIHKIVDVFTKQTEIERYSRMVPMSEIADPKNDYNLNIPRYIDSSEPEDLQDLNAHLNGGIPDRDLDALAPYWDAFPQLRSQLFKPNRPGYSDLTLDVSQVQQAILDSTEFQKFATEADALTRDWFGAWRTHLASIKATTVPNELIGGISDDLLDRFKSVPLLDEYAVYEQLMTYWHETMHDDVGLIMASGWLEASRPRIARIVGKDKSGKPKYEDAHITTGSRASTKRYVMDLIPPDLIINRYFAEDRDELERHQAALEAATEALDEHAAEHGGDEGLLVDAVNDKGKYTQQSLNAVIKEAKAAKDEETLECAHEALALVKAEAAAKKAAKEAQGALDLATISKYGELDADDIKVLVLDDKWSSHLLRATETDVAEVVAVLLVRVEELGSRYERPLSELEALVDRLSDRASTTIDAIEDTRYASTIRLRDVGATYGGLTGKSKGDFGLGEAKFVTFMEVISGPRLMGRRLEKVVVAKSERQNRVAQGDILFNGSSETPEEVALAAVVAFEPPSRTYLNSFCFGFRVKNRDVVDPTYLAYFFRSRGGRNLVSSLAQGATRYNIAKTKLIDVEIPVPTLNRQHEIAAALIEAEDLVFALKDLAWKRQLMGQGVTQRLLSVKNDSEGQT
jgi:type I restriction enzyme M protein